jgi:U3 small nucleolar RNA-associated protein 11
MSESAFKNAFKRERKTHKERSQPHHRRKLGILEKHKDYTERAKDFKKKRDTVRRLREKAFFRNPDEFYHRMITEKRNEEVNSHILKRFNLYIYRMNQNLLRKRKK